MRKLGYLVIKLFFLHVVLTVL